MIKNRHRLSGGSRVKKNKSIIAIGAITLFYFLAGCSMKSEEEGLKAAQEAAKSTFNNNEVETNKNLDKFSLYLPSHFEIKEKSKSNLILQNANQTYILFYNMLEESTSKLNYQAAQSDENSLLLESFEDKKRFGYIRILSMKDEGYELQVGVGGVKISTYTTTGKMAGDAEDMMNIANSIAYKDEER